MAQLRGNLTYTLIRLENLPQTLGESSRATTGSENPLDSRAIKLLHCNPDLRALLLR